MKVSFTPTIVLITVFANTVSSGVLSKRALPDVIAEDLSKISTAITDVSSNLSRLPSETPEVITSFINNLQNLISTIAMAAIDVEGKPTLSETDVDELNYDLNPAIVLLTDMLSTIAERSTIIENIPQLKTAVPEGLSAMESAIAAYGNALVSIDPNDRKPAGVEEFDDILAQFDAVRAVFGS